MQAIRHIQPPFSLPQRLSASLPAYLCDAICRCGAAYAEELRLHSGRVCTVTSAGKSYATNAVLSEDEMNGILKSMCGGSLYAYQQTIREGYLTLEGGIRVGICGRAATENGIVIGVREISGLIVRIPHPVEVSALPLLRRLGAGNGYLRGMLLYAPPGVGKTTLLRAIAREAASEGYGLRTVVVDTREELTYTLDGERLLLDVLVGYPRQLGIEIAVRSLGAQLIVCDEIGDSSDAAAILAAANCGVPLVASAHAASMEELLARPAMARLHRAHVFETYTGLRRGADNRFQLQFTSWGEADALRAPIDGKKGFPSCSHTSFLADC